MSINGPAILEDEMALKMDAIARASDDCSRISLYIVAIGVPESVSQSLKNSINILTLLLGFVFDLQDDFCLLPNET